MAVNFITWFMKNADCLKIACSISTFLCENGKQISQAWLKRKMPRVQGWGLGKNKWLRSESMLSFRSKKGLSHDEQAQFSGSIVQSKSRRFFFAAFSNSNTVLTLWQEILKINITLRTQSSPGIYKVILCLSPPPPTSFYLESTQNREWGLGGDILHASNRFGSPGVTLSPFMMRFWIQVMQSIFILILYKGLEF